MRLDLKKLIHSPENDHKVVIMIISQLLKGILNGQRFEFFSEFFGVVTAVCQDLDLEYEILMPDEAPVKMIKVHLNDKKIKD